MAAKYKLTYFNLKVLGEPVRYLLCYMHADWEEQRVEYADWAQYKHKTPWGKMPILEEDGKVLTESLAILRYLGKKAGLHGKDDWENAQIDIIGDTLADARLPITLLSMETDQEVQKTMKEKFVEETLPFYLKKLEATVKENGGYLANGKLSWVDLLFASIVDLFSFAAGSADVTADFPHLLDLKNRVNSIPQIAQWISKRPNTYC